METESEFTGKAIMAEPGTVRKLSPARRLAGGVLLGSGLALSLALVVQHLGGVGLPGCSADGSCADLAAWPLGRIAGLPISFLGTAYFTGLLAAWLLAKPVVPLDVRVMARAGAAASLILIGAMVATGHFCRYCLATHGINVAFWTLVERSPRSPGARFRTFAAAGAFFVAVAGSLHLVEKRFEETVDAAAKVENREATGRLAVAVDGMRLPAQALKVPVRYCHGLKDAPIQIVVYGDYECEFCRDMDKEVQRLVDSYRGRVSLAVKHYPLCTDCNPRETTDSPHADACRAARAAEAAGILKGNDGFWRMHDWLCQRSGKFGDDELRKFLKTQGYENVEAFVRTMNGPETLEFIHADVTELNGLTSFRIGRIPVVVLNGAVFRTPQGPATLKEEVAKALK